MLGLLYVCTFAQSLPSSHFVAFVILCISFAVFVGLAIAQHDSSSTLASWRAELYKRNGSLASATQLQASKYRANTAQRNMLQRQQHAEETVPVMHVDELREVSKIVRVCVLLRCTVTL